MMFSDDPQQLADFFAELSRRGGKAYIRSIDWEHYWLHAPRMTIITEIIFPQGFDWSKAPSKMRPPREIERPLRELGTPKHD